MAGSHPCAVPDCITPAKIGQLMCRGHWFMVSQKTRRAVNANWRNFKKSPPSYTASRAQAIKEVPEQERPDQQPPLFWKELTCATEIGRAAWRDRECRYV